MCKGVRWVLAFRIVVIEGSIILSSSHEDWQVHTVDAPGLVCWVVHLDIANFAYQVGQIFLFEGSGVFVDIGGSTVVARSLRG